MRNVISDKGAAYNKLISTGVSGVFLKMDYINVDVVTLLLGLVCYVQSYNVDLYGVPLSYKGPAGSYLGFSVAVHSTPGNSWLLVGAPRANSSAQPSLDSPGVIYMCQLTPQLSDPACSQLVLDNEGNTYKKDAWAEIKDHQYLGVSVHSRPGSPPRMVACGHLWRNDFPTLFNDSAYSHWPPNGICYIRDGHPLSLATKTVRFSDYFQAIFYNQSREFKHAFGNSLSGMAVHVAKDGDVYIGRPGLPGVHYDAYGGVDRYKPTTNVKYSLSDIPYSVGKFSYLGYALTTGNIMSGAKSGYTLVTGAPNYLGEGQVLIFRVDGKNAFLLKRINSTQYKSFFGAALLTADVNGDGWDDLFIGSPFHTTRVGDEGVVYVYYGSQNDLTPGPKLTNEQPFSRFGTAITSAGDLDGDGYNDIVISAPYEDDNRGAVYVYNGSPNGVSINYTQRISANELPGQPGGLGFGMAGGFDMDGNGYDDFGVGAYAADQVFVVRSRPVITIVPVVNLQDECMKTEEHVCVSSSGADFPCFAIEYKFAWNSNKPAALAPIHAINWDIVMDDYEALTHRARLIVHGDATGDRQGRVRLRREEEASENFVIQVPTNPVDKVTPVRLITSYSLDADEIIRTDNPFGLAPILNRTNTGIMATEIHFCKSCRDPQICRTDLAVQLRTDATTYVIGQQPTLWFHLDISNGEDGAYNSRVDFMFTKGLQVSPHRSQSCVKGSTDDDSEFEVFSCPLGNPMRAKSSQTLSFALCCSEKLRPNDLRFNAFVSTRSTETRKELENNNVTVIIPAVHEARLQAKGLSNPDELVAIQTTGGRTSTKVTQRAKHVLDVRNDGPGVAPNFTVQIRLPVVDRSDITFTVSDFQVSQGSRGVIPRSCRTIGDVGGQYQTGSVQSRKLASQARSVTLVSDESSSFLTECEIHNLAFKEAVTITYNIDVETSIDETSSTGYTYIADVKLPKYIGREDCGLCQDVQIVTSILSPSAGQSVPLWVILVSVLAGLILLIILVVVLVKVGFFHRNRHEGVVAKRVSKARAKSFIVPEDEVEATRALEDSNPQTPQEEKAAMEQYVSAVMKKS